MKKKEKNEQNQEKELSTDDLNTMYRPKMSMEKIKKARLRAKELGYLTDEDN